VRQALCRGLATVIAAAAFAAVLAASGLASAGASGLASAEAPRYGYYDGEPSNGNGNVSLALDFQVSAGGHRVEHFDVTYVDFTCSGNVEPNVTLSGNGAAKITAGTDFTITLRSTDSSASNRTNGSVVLSGIFAGDGLVTGKFVFTGRGSLAGCRQTIPWKGQVRPRVDHFTGWVRQGSHDAPISFYRTVGAHSQVTDFTIGVLTAACPSGQSAQIRLESGSSLAVHLDAKFGNNVFFTTGDAGSIAGKFQNTKHAAGTVSYAGRDDCAYSLSWSARRVATDILGPFNFGQ